MTMVYLWSGRQNRKQWTDHRGGGVGASGPIEREKDGRMDCSVLHPRSVLSRTPAISISSSILGLRWSGIVCGMPPLGERHFERNGEGSFFGLSFISCLSLVEGRRISCFHMQAQCRHARHSDMHPPAVVWFSISIPSWASATPTTRTTRTTRTRGRI